MSRSSKSSSTKYTDDIDYSNFPEIDQAFITAIWNDEEKEKQGTKSSRLTKLIRSIEADIAPPREHLDSFTSNVESSSSSAKDSRSILKIGESARRIDAQKLKDVRSRKEKGVEGEGVGSGSKQKSKKAFKWW
ncbi:hypothetical protein SDJN03_01297, partial [Cucurbita argyrosperma subsp. sororia]